jgi:hypothetical protein
MKIVLTIAAMLFVSGSASSQINMNDSTVQVISFWDRMEKQSYTVLQEKTKLKGADTTSKEIIRYEVDITVIDSTAKSYTVEWLYKNFDVNTDNKFTQRLVALSENLKVIIKTDELGAFQEVVNWKEVRGYIEKSLEVLKKDFKDVPKINEITAQVGSMFSTKESIESAAIGEIQQYHSFHGARYLLGERLSGQLKAPNLLGGEPFDMDLEVYLDEINPDDNNYIIRSLQTINSKQLTDATYEYLVRLSKSMAVPSPKREDLKDLTNETITASRIHGSGWVIYSVQTKTVTSDDVTSIDERVIEIK